MVAHLEVYGSFLSGLGYVDISLGWKYPLVGLREEDTPVFLADL